MPIDHVGLDADDTLWHNETFFQLTQRRFRELLLPFAAPETIDQNLAAAEQRNLKIYGYGVKGFTLSMLETALEIGSEQLPARVTREILAAGRELITHPVETLPGVAGTLAELSADHKLVLITKGDLFHQESKLAASGLGDYFSGIEIVSEKTPATYRTVFARHGSGPERALMAGNSVRSDILPALEAGSHAALIPYALVWAHESAAIPDGHPRFKQLISLNDLPAWLRELP